MSRRSIARALAFAALLASLGALGTASADTVLITGANSGLGLEFTKQYAAKGWTVIATHRRNDVPESLAAVMKEHPKVRVERMDVADIASVKALASKLEGVPIDVLINNAGIYSDRAGCPDEACRGEGRTQSFGNMDYALFDRIMAVNVRGPLVVSESFIDNLRTSKQKKIVSISSTSGSLTEPLEGSRAISYRASKAALNREMQLVAVHEKNEGVIVVLLHPGSVLTERQAGFTLPGMIEMQPSVRGMIEQIAKVTIADTGRFIQYDGTSAPW
jgi:NAD(P)-dependent dehydrogenase (short-subunit alcohol dehydrogenase family)